MEFPKVQFIGPLVFWVLNAHIFLSYHSCKGEMIIFILQMRNLKLKDIH